MAREYNLNIIKASNGWVVRSHDGRSGSYPMDIMVATDDQDLAGLIAAAIVSQKLEGVGEDPHTEPAPKLKAPNGLIRRAPTAPTTASTGSEIDKMINELRKKAGV